MRKKILIIDEDYRGCEEIKSALQNDTTEVVCTHSVREAVLLFASQTFCLVIMDIRLSETEGMLLLKTFRKMKTVPVLVLSSAADPKEKVNVLRAGACGYIGKPYDMEECLAHALSLMRLYLELHSGEQRCYTLAFGMDLVIEPELRKVMLKGKEINLTRKEFELLFCLASHVGKVLSRAQLYQMVWEENASFNIDELVKAHIKSLRKKLSFGGKEYIKNEWGIGYRFLLDEGQP